MPRTSAPLLLTCLPSVGEMHREQKNKKKKKGFLPPRQRNTAVLQPAVITFSRTGLTFNTPSRNAAG